MAHDHEHRASAHKSPGEIALLTTLAPGSEFAGRYQVEELLGRGAMGVVYRVVDRQLGDTVALKLLTVDPADDTVARFRREVRLARRITHRHVARIHDIGEHQGVHFLSMEYVGGPSLEEAMTAVGRSLGTPRAVRIGIQVAAGLAAAHAVEVVHRDLKPANVLLENAGSESERVVITDFGIARAPREEALTHAHGALVGTPAYMSPEQVLGEAVDARSDVYALGLLLYEMLTGELPFLRDGEGVFAVAMARCRRPADDPRTIAQVPDRLAELLIHCLATSRDERPAHALEVAAELERWLSTSSGVRNGDLAALHLHATLVAGREQAAPVIGSGPPRATGREPSATGSQPGARGSQPGATGSQPGSTATDRSPAGFASRPPSGPFAPLPTVQSAIAVLPFRYRGPEADSYLADSLGEELIDVLSSTRNLRVLSSGATERFRDARDPRAIGGELGVDAVIDATMHRAGAGFRVTVRLIDVASGVQTWSERYETSIGDALALQDTLSQRIAEALRIEITTPRPGDEAPAEAVELYLNARRHMRTRDFMDWDTPVLLLERALEIAPHFRVAQAAHAIATVRGWWAAASTLRDWAEAARASVARARAEAPELAESHLACAMLAVQGGDLANAAVELAQALDIAPTYADAQRYLGDLQCEAGRVDEGLRRLRLAIELDPEAWGPHVSIARVMALRGQREEAEKHLQVLVGLRGDRGLATLGLRMRFAAWWGDHETLRDLVQRNAGDPDIPRQFLVTLGRYVLGGDDNLGTVREAVRWAKNPRMISLIEQMCAEAYGMRGETELAMQCVRKASSEALVDVEWLERCPALAEVRKRDDFRPVYNEVRTRAMGIWKA